MLMNQTIESVRPGARFFPDVSGNEADYLKNRRKNEKTTVDLGHEPAGKPSLTRSPQRSRSPNLYNQHYSSPLAGKVWVGDGYKDADLSATVILNRSRSKQRSRSNERLGFGLEEPAGKKSSFRKMIEANLPDDSVWHQHRTVDARQTGSPHRGSPK